MTTAAYYCPRCGWRVDVQATADIPHCRDCDGGLLPLDAGMKRGRRTAIAGLRPGEAKACDGRPNPMYPRGEG